MTPPLIRHLLVGAHMSDRSRDATLMRGPIRHLLVGGPHG